MRVGSIAGVTAFNSLSRDHLMILARMRFPCSNTFNSLSRDHFDNFIDDYPINSVNFQLPLSGSPVEKPREFPITLVPKLSTPSLGITC